MGVYIYHCIHIITDIMEISGVHTWKHTHKKIAYKVLKKKEKKRFVADDWSVMCDP